MEEKNKPFTVRFKPSLKEKIKEYSSISKKTEAKIINEALTDYFKEKILTNEYIELDKPYYINSLDLFKDGKALATVEKPDSNFNYQMVINKIVNNLDSWNKEYNTYCYENSIYSHKGILLNVFYFIDVGKIEPVYLLFNYTTNKLDFNADLLKSEELTISYVKHDELPIVLDTVKHKELLAELKEQEKEIRKDISEGLEYGIIQGKYNKLDIIRFLKQEKGLVNISSVAEDSIKGFIENPEDFISNDGFSKAINSAIANGSIPQEEILEGLKDVAEEEDYNSIKDFLKGNNNLVESLIGSVYEETKDLPEEEQEKYLENMKEEAIQDLNNFKENVPEGYIELFNSIVNSEENNVPLLNKMFDSVFNVKKPEDMDKLYNELSNSSKKKD